jgi:uncharacterized membrane protein YphA (DoxX/SURF4 family)
MNPIAQATKCWFDDSVRAWDRFWFTPAQPHTLALIRVLGGAMLFYTHLVWGLRLNAFLGPQAFIDNATALKLQEGWYSWSYLWYIESPALLWTLHIAALVIFALLTLGLFTRVVAVLACLITLAYCHRLHGAQFGLDQVNAMLAMYLMLAPCGEVFSLDRWLSIKRAGQRLAPRAFVSTNIAIRLIQLHMCVIYLFGGISKLRGQMWWDGSAVWGAIANLEYQSIDLTWLAHYPWIIAALTHATIFWETFYCFTVWPKWSRPLTLAMAVAVHGGIAAALGMVTFGLAMIIANLAFISPSLVAATVNLCCRWSVSEQGRGGESAGQPPKSRTADRRVSAVAVR